ncbi:hypothetical protein ACUZX0_01335 [Serratia marcescens]|uniref:hypothetical protein n=1 Tax=Serratia TaxID=613 RepID=UPI0009079BA8|nr:MULTISPECIES: hypothetical protein [Serratia]MBH3050599.1 hypothetical protein [Serratia marcescens]MDI3445972.1 hypothetical protein [Serratia marcescens]MDR8492632.1 hypothetical protein [Serratia nevei]MDU4688613.1 hypothetical protein [Serratia marcescens]HEI9922972.1 hypothetical protein [Serratia marcescens]
MTKNNLPIQPVLITREGIQQQLGGISRTTFWRRKKQWEKAGTPFPKPAPGTNPIHGGEQYRYCDVIRFFRAQGLIDETQDAT